MKNEVNPIVAVIVVVVVLVGIGAFVWARSGGRTFNHNEARGRLGSSIDADKAMQAAGQNK